MEGLFTIVALGETAKDWIPRGHSIGVNDSWRWGKPTDSLLVCNRPSNFTEERLKIITESKPKTFYSHKSNWAYAFPAWQKINLCQWYGRLVKGQHYSSNTSPFIAMTLAYNLGAKDIILWGVQLLDHKIFNNNNRQTKKEVMNYVQLIEEMDKQNVNVYLGCGPSALEPYVKIYDKG